MRVELRDVAAGYGGAPVVRGVSAEVPAGGWLAVVGPNGAGKSTLLKAVAGLVRSTGVVEVGGRAVGGLRARERARLIGYAPQVAVVPDGLAVADYALLGRTPHLDPLAREGRADREVVAGVLDRLDLAHLADRPLRALSGGERQRAVLARVLAQQTGVLLLDEPTTGLDIGHAQALLDLVDRLRAEDGTTVVSTLHDLVLAAQYADRLLLVDGGGPVAHGSPADVLTQEVVARHYAAEVEVLRTRGGHPAVVPSRPV
ncbi:ABC transporter ATP-binding protein [Actinokineospora bangkokensis]|uniref:ABC transporter n=1 Tax=Actinokineospora bangkokensis TaxID=1193682 RepID=A0A1Q9LQF5_9PSEU|nr:ABC transporter ATP-binding protein [Actinokineospora bangkokensis]OLR94252.1 ABC transporter [Actinokineospora bangkokensis]